MKNLIAFILLAMPALSASAQKPMRDTIPVEISFEDPSTDESSVGTTVHIVLDGHDIDRFYFDAGDSIIYKREIKEASGEHRYFCQILHIPCGRDYKWELCVHSRTNGLIKRVPFKFSTRKCLKKSEMEEQYKRK